MIREYYNQDGERLYILHFSGVTYDSFGHLIAEKNKDTKITVDEDISIISPVNEDFYNKSPLMRQLENSGIQLYNSEAAFNDTKWNNTRKINYVLECLDKVKTKYALITDARDVIFVNNLDKSFIEAYKSFGKPILYNSTSTRFPNVQVEPQEEIDELFTYNKFLNAGVCFGEVEALKKFYKHCLEIKDTFENNYSEQLIIRTARLDMPELIAIDYDAKIIRNYHANDGYIQRLYDDETGPEVRKFKIFFRQSKGA